MGCWFTKRKDKELLTKLATESPAWASQDYFSSNFACGGCPSWAYLQRLCLWPNKCPFLVRGQVMGFGHTLRMPSFPCLLTSSACSASSRAQELDGRAFASSLSKDGSGALQKTMSWPNQTGPTTWAHV